MGGAPHRSTFRVWYAPADLPPDLDLDLPRGGGAALKAGGAPLLHATDVVDRRRGGGSTGGAAAAGLTPRGGGVKGKGGGGEVLVTAGAAAGADEAAAIDAARAHLLRRRARTNRTSRAHRGAAAEGEEAGGRGRPLPLTRGDCSWRRAVAWAYNGGVLLVGWAGVAALALVALPRHTANSGLAAAAWWSQVERGLAFAPPYSGVPPPSLTVVSPLPPLQVERGLAFGLLNTFLVLDAIKVAPRARAPLSPPFSPPCVHGCPHVPSPERARPLPALAARGCPPACVSPARLEGRRRWRCSS